MLKLIDCASYYPDELQVTIINPDNLQGLTKQAADERITSFAKNIQPKAGKIYLHINAMGAGEYYGANKNGDWFPENNLKEYYQTFETSPAHIFRHHINKRIEGAIGQVLFAIYNDRMHRVELIAEVDKILGADIESRLAMGDHPSTSMACKTPYDVCSICGNKAHTRQEYCSHLTDSLGQLQPDGKRVMALNVGPLKFFDMSIVIRPADVTSGVLQKVAFAGTVSSAELAEDEGLVELNKESSIRKLADLIKEIDGQVDNVSPELEKIYQGTKAPNHGLINQLKLFSLTDTLHVLAELGISPPMEFLCELIARKVLGDAGYGLGKVIAEKIGQANADTTFIPNLKFEKIAQLNPLVLKLLSPCLDDCSLLPEYVEKRASVGYASFSPYDYENPHVTTEPAVHKPSFLKTLLMIGGAAILAKMYISKVIQEKLASRDKDYGVKISIVKQASDYQVAFNIAKYATARELTKKEQKNLDNFASHTRKVLALTDSRLGNKASKVIKLVQFGPKIVDKLSNKDK